MFYEMKKLIFKRKYLFFYVKKKLKLIVIFFDSFFYFVMNIYKSKLSFIYSNDILRLLYV